MEIRPITAADLPNILPLAKQMHEETEFRRLEWAEDKVKAFIGTLIKSPNHIGMVALDKGEMIGFVAGVKMEHFFSNERLAKDLGLYVRLDKRGSRAAYKLMDAFVEWVESSEPSVSALVVQVSTGGENMKSANRFFAHWGMEEIGGSFRRFI